MGAIRIVTNRSRGFEMLLVAIIPGMAQAKLDNKGIKDLPDKPITLRRSSKSVKRLNEQAQTKI